MAPLATTVDLTARGIDFTQPLADVYLGVASAAVRDAAGCPISAATSTVQVYGDGSPWLRLPGPPVTAVISVVLDGQTLVEGTDWALVDGALYRPCGWEVCSPLPKPATVVQEHGLDPVPADIVDLVCRMTASALVAAASAEDGSGLAVDRIASERLGDYSVTYDREAGTTEMELSERTRGRLAARFGAGAAMVGTR